jgi:hypothetical protein
MCVCVESVQSVPRTHDSAWKRAEVQNGLTVHTFSRHDFVKYSAPLRKKCKVFLRFKKAKDDVCTELDLRIKQTRFSYRSVIFIKLILAMCLL